MRRDVLRKVELEMFLELLRMYAEYYEECMANELSIDPELLDEDEIARRIDEASRKCAQLARKMMGLDGPGSSNISDVDQGTRELDNEPE